MADGAVMINIRRVWYGGSNGGAHSSCASSEIAAMHGQVCSTEGGNIGGVKVGDCVTGGACAMSILCHSVHVGAERDAYCSDNSDSNTVDVIGSGMNHTAARSERWRENAARWIRGG